MASVKTEREFGAPIEKVYAAITHFSSYPEFLPEVVGAKVQPSGNPAIVVVDFEIEVMKRFQYSLEFHLTEPSEIAWKLKESNFFKKNEGRWALTASSKEKTQVIYELEITLGFFVPNWVTKKLTEVNLPSMFEQFEKRAQAKV